MANQGRKRGRLRKCPSKIEARVRAKQNNVEEVSSYLLLSISLTFGYNSDDDVVAPIGILVPNIG